MLTERLIFAYYTKDLHNNIAIWVKRSKKNTLLESFEEARQIEKDILRLKGNLNSEAETTSSSKKKIEILTRPPQAKNQLETLDLESLQKAFQKLSNQVVDLKRSAKEESSSKGSFKPPFKKPFPPNRANSATEGLNFESLQYALQTILEAHDNSASIPFENFEDVVEEEVLEEEESSPNIFGHFSEQYLLRKFQNYSPLQHKKKNTKKNFC
jgi:hypothetical protein